MKIRKFLKALGATFLSAFAVVALVSCSDSKAIDEAMQRLSLLLDMEVEKAKDSGLSSNLEVPYSIEVNHKEYEVTYTTTLEDNAKLVPNLEDAENKIYVVEITQTGEAQNFTLTATIEKKTKSWDFTIAAKDVSMLKTQAEINAMENLVDHAGWVAAANKTDVVIQGWITHAHDFSASYNNVSVWLQDENGGYYGYRVTCTQNEYNEYFKTGQKIALVGKTSPYGGWLELGSGGKYYVITDAESKTFEYEDITSVWSANKATDAAALAVQNKKVKVTAKITSVPDYSSSQMSIGLSVGGNDYTAFCKSNYFKIPTDFVKDLKVGYTVEISGLAAVSSNKAQICPVTADAIKVTSTEVTPQDQVNGAVAEVKNQNVLSAYYDSLDKPLELMTTTADGCSVKYELADVKKEGITLVDGNKLNVVVDPKTNSSATLKATITKDGAATPATYEWKIETKTDSNVIADLKASVSNQKMTKVFGPDDLSARQDLLDVVSPSKQEASVEYTVPTNEYIKIGVKKSGIQYIEVLKTVPADQEAVMIPVTATIKYADKTETTKIIITVGVPAKADVEIVIKDLGYENAADFLEKKVNDDVTLTGAQAAHASLPPKYYDLGEAVRIYGGNTFTITSTKKIAKIVFEFVESNPIAENVGTLSSGEFDYGTGVWTGSANELVINNESKSQIRIVKISIYYEK